MKLKKVMAICLTMLMAASLSMTGCGEKSTDGEKKGDKDSVTIKWISQGPGEDSWEGLTKSILEEYEKIQVYMLKQNFILLVIYLK